MRTLSIQAEVDDAGHLKLDVPTDLPKGQVDVVLVLSPRIPENLGPDRFADISGKLQWKGDAVARQRSLRDEW